jgi:hypothetical protein
MFNEIFNGIEALLDFGRHLLTKGFGCAATEYKAIGHKLAEMGIIPDDRVANFARSPGIVTEWSIALERRIKALNPNTQLLA